MRMSLDFHRNIGPYIFKMYIEDPDSADYATSFDIILDNVVIWTSGKFEPTDPIMIGKFIEGAEFVKGHPAATVEIIEKANKLLENWKT